MTMIVVIIRELELYKLSFISIHSFILNRAHDSYKLKISIKHTRTDGENRRLGQILIY